MITRKSLDFFMSEIESRYPKILPLIKIKNENFVELELDNDGWKTFAEQAKDLEPILGQYSTLPIKNTHVSFNEKDNYFKITIKLA
jgi:hypothetical protein